MGFSEGVYVSDYVQLPRLVSVVICLLEDLIRDEKEAFVNPIIDDYRVNSLPSNEKRREDLVEASRERFEVVGGNT